MAKEIYLDALDTAIEHNIIHEVPEKSPVIHVDSIKKLTRFTKFFSNVSSLSVADTVPEGTQLALVHALKEVE